MVTAWKKGKSPEYVIELVKKMPKIKIKMVSYYAVYNNASILVTLPG